jgi:hypothetical protein
MGLFVEERALRRFGKKNKAQWIPRSIMRLSYLKYKLGLMLKELGEYDLLGNTMGRLAIGLLRHKTTYIKGIFQRLTGLLIPLI